MMPEIEIETETEFEADFDESDAYIDLEYYRRLVRTYVDMRRYKTALYWAEKVSTLSNNHPGDIYWQAQCMFLLKEYHRAVHLIRHNQLERKDVLCHYLIVECLLEAKEYTEALELLNSVDVESLVSNTSVDQSKSFIEQSKSEIQASIWFLKGKVLETMDNRTMAIDCYVQALHLSVHCTEALDALVQHEMLQAWEEHELMKNLPFSQQCSETDAKLLKKLYESKLKKYYDSDMSSNPAQTPSSKLTDINVLSALTGLGDAHNAAGSNAHKATGSNAHNVTGSNDLNIDRSKLFTPVHQNILSPANKILQDLKSTSSYNIHASLSKTSYCSSFDSSKTCETPKAKTSSTCKTAIPYTVACERIQSSLDMQVAKAERYFYNSEYRKCLHILDDCLLIDPYHSACLIILIGCFVELKEFNKLFYTAHKLVDLYPDQAISWYAVGCYYDLIGRSEPARRYLAKATTLDRLFGPAWLAYGHSFAKENEHDQAMAAYFKATQLMRGCHLPLLYIGAECGLTKNLELAEKFFYQAMSIAPQDVGVLHEIGVLKFDLEEFDRAEEIFKTTLAMVTKIAEQNNEAISQRWEPLLNNLAHCCRKNKKYDEALKYHQQALVLKPQNASSYTGIGFVQALMGQLDKAVDSLHRSLAIKRDDVVTSALLKYVIEDIMDDPLPSSIVVQDEKPPKLPEEKPLISDETPPVPMKKLTFDSSVNSELSEVLEVDEDGSDMSLDT